MGWEERMRRARKLHRPSLSDWECDGLFHSFPEFARDLIERDLEGKNSRDYEAFIPDEEHTPVVAPLVPSVLNAQTLSTRDFWDNYEAQEIPCVIRNIPLGFDGAQATDPWPAVEKWPIFKLRQDQELRDRVFKCGEDDDGRSIKVKLKHFLRYCRSNKDDSPLYIFDTSFDEDRRAKRILQDFTVPCYFRDDLFGFISESRRAPYRWFLVGPERSGTTVHIDPLATNAWNTLIEGKKRWVLFPPHVPKSVVKGKGLVRDDEDDEAIHYFMFILPRIKRQASAFWQQQRHSAGHQQASSQSPYHQFCCYEFTQHAGETVFIPNGWWHAVLNLTDTVGVTQNFCSERNFDHVWRKTRTGRPRMAWKWLQQLEARPRYQHLASRAKEMNAEDDFVMKYDPVEIARREEKRHEREIERQKQRQHKKDHSNEDNRDGGRDEGDTDEDDSSSDGNREGMSDRRRKHQRRM